MPKNGIPPSVDIPNQTQSVAESSEFVDGWLTKGAEAAIAENFEESLAAFERVLEHEPSNCQALYGKTFCLRRLRRLEEAHKSLATGLTECPEDFRLHKEAGLVANQEEHYEDALAAFDRVLELEPDNEDAFYWKAESLRQAGRSSEVEEALANAPETLLLLLVRAYAQFDENHFDAAIAGFDRVLELEPDNEDAFYWKAESLRKAERSSEVEGVLANAPETPRVALVRGFARFDLGNFDAAIAGFDRVLELEPDNEDAFYWKGESLRQAGRSSEVEEALANAPETPLLLLVRAYARFDENQFDEAIAGFDRVLELEPDNEDAFYWKADSLRKAERSSEVEGALANAPETPRVALVRGFARFDLGNFDAAIAGFDRVLELEPDNEDAFYWKAESLRQAGRSSEVEGALANAPETPLLLLVRAYARFDENHFDEAIAGFDRVLELEPDNEDAFYWKADSLRLANRSREAEELIRPRILANDVSPRVVNLMGWILLDQHRTEEARQFFDRSTSGLEDLEVRTALGALAFEEEHYATAEREFRGALAVERSSTTLTNLAWALVQQRGQQRRDEAEGLCTESLSKNSTYAATYGCLGMVAYQKDQLTAAEAYFKKSIDLDEAGGDWSDLGALYVKMGLFDEAMGCLKRAIERDRFDLQARIELGNLHLKRSQIDEALNHFQQAHMIGDLSGRAVIGEGYALFSKGDLVGADRLLKRAMSKQPKNWSREMEFLAHISRAEVLLKRGEISGDRFHFSQAVEESIAAVEAQPSDPRGHQLAAYAYARLGEGEVSKKFSYRRRALHHLKNCDQTDPEVVRMEHYVEESISKSQDPQNSKRIVLVVSMALLAVLWIGFFFSEKVDSGMVMTLTPVLAGLVIVALVMPALHRLKLAGLDMELRVTEELTLGPLGSFGSTPPDTGTLPALQEPDSSVESEPPRQDKVGASVQSKYTKATG